MSQNNKKTKESIIVYSDNAVKKFSIVMEYSNHDGVVFDYNIVLDYLNDLGECSAILHDRDVELDGSQKRYHIHIVINLNTKIRKNTLLNKSKEEDAFYISYRNEPNDAKCDYIIDYILVT